jgi:putative ABC transport system permease protein
VGGLWLWLRAEMRRRWRAWLAVALIAGVGWGAVLTAVAGARRTRSAFTRFRADTHARDLLVTGDGPALKGFAADVERLPDVVAAGPFQALNVEVTDPPPPASFLLGAAFIPVVGFRTRRTRRRVS